MASVVLISCLASPASAMSYDSNYPTTNTDGNGYAHLKDPVTGISVTLSNSDKDMSFGFMAQKMQGPSNGEKGASLKSPDYYGIAVLGVSDGTVRICVPHQASDQAATMRYWAFGNWYGFAKTRTGDGVVCGTAPLDSFVGRSFAYTYTDIAIGDLSS